jgi:LSD1 subclass zinc finger protein
LLYVIGGEKLVAVSQELLEILVCPLCKTPVKLTPNQQGLKCASCGRVYPIRSDIPVMLVDEATIDKE